MDLKGWDERYRTADPQTDPAPLLIQMASHLRPGSALDLACGTGRNALWLAGRGWEVTAVDGSAVAIEILRRRAPSNLRTQVADLERGDYRIEAAAWDLILMCRYLQRDLFEPAKQGLKPGGIVIVVVNLVERGKEPTATRARAGELAEYFRDWQILHYREAATAEIVARK
jgi:SAM-dependent methyltransferase